LLLVVELNGPTMMARIGVMQALNRPPGADAWTASQGDQSLQGHSMTWRGLPGLAHDGRHPPLDLHGAKRKGPPP